VESSTAVRFSRSLTDYRRSLFSVTVGGTVEIGRAKVRRNEDWCSRELCPLHSPRGMWFYWPEKLVNKFGIDSEDVMRFGSEAMRTHVCKFVILTALRCQLGLQQSATMDPAEPHRSTTPMRSEADSPHRSGSRSHQPPLGRRGRSCVRTIDSGHRKWNDAASWFGLPIEHLETRLSGAGGAAPGTRPDEGGLVHFRQSSTPASLG
jgi:hypothetical protein